jgi:hypothetical protein
MENLNNYDEHTDPGTKASYKKCEHIKTIMISTPMQEQKHHIENRNTSKQL